MNENYFQSFMNENNNSGGYPQGYPSDVPSLQTTDNILTEDELLNNLSKGIMPVANKPKKKEEKINAINTEENINSINQQQMNYQPQAPQPQAMTINPYQMQFAQPQVPQQQPVIMGYDVYGNPVYGYSTPTPMIMQPQPTYNPLANMNTSKSTDEITNNLTDQISSIADGALSPETIDAIKTMAANNLNGNTLANYNMQQMQNMANNNFINRPSADALSIAAMNNKFNPMPYTPGMVSTPQFESANGNTAPAEGYNLLKDIPVAPNSGNPYYYPQQPVPQPQGLGNPYIAAMNGGVYNPYTAQLRAQFMSPYMRPYGYGMGYPMNEMDMYLQEILYNDRPALNDPNWLANVILSDEEREKINHKQSQGMYIIGSDYFGNPIYGNPYLDNQNKQKDFENACKAYQDHFVMLSRIAAAYTGEEWDEQKARDRWDPVKIMQGNTPKPKYDMSTPEGRKEYYADLRMDQTADIVAAMKRQEQMQPQLDAYRQQLFAKIKQSHDNLLGLTPGSTLGDYMDNGYKLLYNIEMDKARMAARQSASSKYDRQMYQQGIASRVAARDGGPVMNLYNLTKDDDTVSIEERLRHQYYSNKQSQPQSLMLGGPSRFKYTMSEGAKPLEGDEAFKAMYDALKAEAYKKKVEVDARKLVNQ